MKETVLYAYLRHISITVYYSVYLKGDLPE